jgi:hypothetical protein
MRRAVVFPQVALTGWFELFLLCGEKASLMYVLRKLRSPSQAIYALAHMTTLLLARLVSKQKAELRLARRIHSLPLQYYYTILILLTCDVPVIDTSLYIR